MERPDPIVRNLSEDEKLALKKKKPQLGGAGNVPDSAMPVLAGGTGEKPGPMIQPGILSPQQREEAKRARLEVDRLANAHNAAYNDPNFKRGANPALADIRAAQSDARLSAGAYERQAKGFATQPMTAEQHAVGVYKLRQQEEAIRAQQQNAPAAGGDTAHQAGLSVLPKNLRDQKFSNPLDQANHYQFVRDAGQNNMGMNAGREFGRDEYGVATGVTSPADRLKAQGDSQRAEAMAKLGAPRQDYATYDPAAAKAYVERDQAGYQAAQDSAVDARSRMRESEMLARKAQVAPVEAGLAAVVASKAGSEAAAATSGAGMEQAKTAEQMARIQREAMLGTPGDTKIPPQIQAQISQADNAAKESLRATEQATRARDLSLDNPDPTWQRAVSILANLPTRINTLKSPTVLPTPENIAQAEVTDQHLSELEAMLPQLSPYQRQSVLQKIRDSVGDETNLENRPAIEQATKASFLNITNPLALGQAIMGQNQQADPRAVAIKRAQDRINKFRAMR